MCLGYDLKNPCPLWKKPGSHFGTWWRSHDPLLTTWWAQKSKSAAGRLYLVTVVMHCRHGKKHGCCQLQYPIPIGDVEYTSLETKPHLYDPLAPEDASHRQHTRQVTDISGRSRRCLSGYNTNTRPDLKISGSIYASLFTRNHNIRNMFTQNRDSAPKRLHHVYKKSKKHSFMLVSVGWHRSHKLKFIYAVSDLSFKRCVRELFGIRPTKTHSSESGYPLQEPQIYWFMSTTSRFRY